MTLRVVIVDDQPLARLRLRDLLEDVEDVECVAEASDGAEAIRVIRREIPDVVFLDIQMPGTSGIDVLRALDPPPLAIFTTAHERHAVTAFELHALDYLLKPFGPERLAASLARARAALGASKQEPSTEPLPREIQGRSADGNLERVFVRRRGQIVPVVIKDVEHLEANGDYVTLWEGERSYLMRVGLAELVARLDPETFVQVHRSHAVNLDRVQSFGPFDGSRLEIVLKTGKRLVASRARSAELRARFSL